VRLAAGRRSAELSLPGGVAVSRDAFDAALVREAEAAGVTFRPGVALRSPPADAVTILATGLAGSDARPDPRSRLGAGVIVPAPAAPDFFAPGTVYMATGRGGYVGLVRVEGGKLAIAAAFDAAFVKSSGGLGPAAGAILSATGWPVVHGLAELPWKGTPALTRKPVAVAGRRWFAAGDAAGYVEPFTGEGMAWAVASAAAVAPLAVKAVAGWDDRFVREWQRAHARLVGRRQRVCRVVARVLRSPALTGLAVRLLASLPVLARPTVVALNRPPVIPHGSPV
jgi:2-polyprenyl-6-methoxyphenol hydroxylase-like FAD-dependent oxidoreductase